MWIWLATVAVVLTGQLAVGTVRVGVMTDSSGNIINTPLTFSNQASMAVAASNGTELVRFREFTNGIAGVSNVTVNAVTNLVGDPSFTFTRGPNVVTNAFTGIITNNATLSNSLTVVGSTLFQGTVIATNTVTLTNFVTFASNSFFNGVALSSNRFLFHSNAIFTAVATHSNNVDVVGNVTVTNGSVNVFGQGYYPSNSASMFIFTNLQVEFNTWYTNIGQRSWVECSVTLTPGATGSSMVELWTVDGNITNARQRVSNTLAGGTINNPVMSWVSPSGLYMFTNESTGLSSAVLLSNQFYRTSH